MFVFLNSCASVKLKNSEWCGDLGNDGASCFNTHNDNIRDVLPEAWEKERFGMLCTKAETFADWKATILKLCKLAGNRCSYDEQKNLVIFMDKVNGFQKAATYLAKENGHE